MRCCGCCLCDASGHPFTRPFQTFSRSSNLLLSLFSYFFFLLSLDGILPLKPIHLLLLSLARLFIARHRWNGHFLLLCVSKWKGARHLRGAIEITGETCVLCTFPQILFSTRAKSAAAERYGGEKRKPPLPAVDSYYVNSISTPLLRSFAFSMQLTNSSFPFRNKNRSCRHVTWWRPSSICHGAPLKYRTLQSHNQRLAVVH